MTTDGEKKKKEMPTTYKTEIGNVVGQVHSGSGDIVVQSFKAQTVISTKDEFLEALGVFREEVEAFHENGLPEEITDDITIEITGAELEAQKEQPKADRIVKRLGNIKSILIAAAGVATATTATIEASSQLLPLVEKAIELASQIF